MTCVVFELLALLGDAVRNKFGITRRRVVGEIWIQEERFEGWLCGRG